MATPKITIDNVHVIEVSVMVRGHSTSRTAMQPGEWQDFEQAAVNDVHRRLKIAGFDLGSGPIKCRYKTQPETCADGKLNVRVIVQ